MLLLLQWLLLYLYGWLASFSRSSLDVELNFGHYGTTTSNTLRNLKYRVNENRKNFTNVFQGTIEVLARQLLR